MYGRHCAKVAARGETVSRILRVCKLCSAEIKTGKVCESCSNTNKICQRCARACGYTRGASDDSGVDGPSVPTADVLADRQAAASYTTESLIDEPVLPFTIREITVPTDAIQRRAYELFEARNREAGHVVHGFDEQDWFEARRQLEGEESDRQRALDLICPAE